MIEFLLAFLHIYLMCGFFVAMMFPMIRCEFIDERHVFMRRSGETGAEFIGKVILAGLGWPAVIGAIGYYWLTNFIIPWLTQPR